MANRARLRQDLITTFNRTHERIAKMLAEGVSFDDVVRRSRLRPQKLSLLLKNPELGALIDKYRVGGPQGAPVKIDTLGELTLAQLASRERRKSIEKLAEIRDSAESETAKVQAASAIINQTKDIAHDEDALHVVATPENVERMLKAAEDVKWFADRFLDNPLVDDETAVIDQLQGKTDEEEHVSASEPRKPGHEVPVGSQGDPPSVRQVPIRI